MKTASELYSEKYGTDNLIGDIFDYTPMLEQFGEILIKVDDDDYQGDSYLIYKKENSYGYLRFGWGSCSGCDALQACNTIQEVQELMDTLYNDIIWFDTLAELKDYFAKKDWALEYSWHIEGFKDFLNQVEQLNEKGEENESWKPHNESPYFNGLMHGIVIGVFLCALVVFGGYISRKSPTLEITYRDSVAVDSVVYKVK